MLNWRSRDINLFDDYRPIFDTFNPDEKGRNAKLYCQLTMKGFYAQVFFFFVERTLYT